MLKVNDKCEQLNAVVLEVLKIEQLNNERLN